MRKYDHHHPFISYAQNYEDVMLERALQHIEKGFYIDIGAASPHEDSVTKAFYNLGWRGINIEPNAEYYAQLQAHRPHDTNLAVVINQHEGEFPMQFITYPTGEPTGLSTLNADIATQHVQNGLSLKTQKVNAVTLEFIWKQYVPKNQEVHFLKIDVEGSEKSVLQSKDWTHGRPWIVLLEATWPDLSAYQDWEPILLNADYQFAYADGLNRFYIANEHIDLLPQFQYPPNVFDSFIRQEQQSALTRAHKAEAELHYLLTSSSWRITGRILWARLQAHKPTFSGKSKKLKN
ncbi:MAG: FkbM family methyltransferase [Legionellaceae bacterium]|nr:FkbM family methyltransferase [Legionellaceae bacterium]